MFTYRVYLPGGDLVAEGSLPADPPPTVGAIEASAYLLAACKNADALLSHLDEIGALSARRGSDSLEFIKAWAAVKTAILLATGNPS
jgi:hypothetical protein